MIISGGSIEKTTSEPPRRETGLAGLPPFILKSCFVGRMVLASALALVMSAPGAPETGPPDGDAGAEAAWAGVPAILARIVPPVFPKKDFAITEFGAVPGGGKDCREAIAAAIDKCAAAGGGRVVVPPGKFLTGPIHLKSNVDLHLEDGAELVFSDRFEDYLPVVPVRVGGIDILNYSPLVYARDCTNIAVTGKGKLNGNAKKWWEWKGKETGDHFKAGAEGLPLEKRVFGTPEAAIRPNFLVLLNCRNILLEDFTIGSGPNWTIHPIYCGNVTVRRVTVDTDGPNNDGLDPDSCRDVLIENCTFSTGDDCVVLKSGYNEDGWRVNKPTENVVMRHCVCRQGHGGLVIGSEMSGGVRNVFVEDCEFDGTDRAIRIKSRVGRGGVVEKIYGRNLKAKDMRKEVVILNMDYASGQNPAPNEKRPVFRDMCFEHIEGNGAPTALSLVGDADSPIQNIRFRDLNMKSGKGLEARFVRNILFQRLQLDLGKDPAFGLESASGIRIADVKTARDPKVFLALEGSASGAVTIRGCPHVTQATASRVLKLGKDVPPDSVRIEDSTQPEGEK